MFLISSGQKPDSIDGLQRILGGGLNLSFQVNDGAQRIQATGTWPDIDRLTVNLTGLALDPLRPPPAPDGLNPSAGESWGRYGQLTIQAAPLRLAPAGRLFLEVHASGVDFVMTADRQNRCWFTPSSLDSGHVEARISGKDLEHVFLENATQAAAAHGVTVEEGRLQMRQTGPQQLQVSAELTARKLFVKGSISLEGNLELDEQLNLHFSGLDCSGQGMIGSIATRFLHPHLAAWNQRSFPLLANILPSVRLHHVELQTGNDGQIRATARVGGTGKARIAQ